MTSPKRDPDKLFETRVGESPVSIGRYTYGTANLRVLQWKEGASLRIGNFCSIAEGLTVLLGGNHRADWVTTYPFGHVFVSAMAVEPVKNQSISRGDVIIGNDVWLGHHVTIMSGVTIGDGAVIAANAHVVRDVPPYAIAGGNPAVVIRQRFDPQVCRLLQELRWWDLPIEAIREMVPALCDAPDERQIGEWIARYR